MKNIYGSIGYTLLKNENLIIIFADKHDDLPKCDNKIDMANWFRTKFKTSIILLEEVPRVPNSKIVGLWEQSLHTKMLKDVYLENPSIIKPVDIRHYLIPFSWEIIEDTQEYNITLRRYMLNIDRFFSMRNKYLLKNCTLYNVEILKTIQLGRHFLNIKEEFNQLIIRAQKVNILDNKLFDIKILNQDFLEDINNLISRIMEWYICACIYNNKNKPLIIHVGLAHSEQIVKLLKETYNYSIIEEQGINKLNDIDNPNLNGCVKISDKLNEQFGGYL